MSNEHILVWGSTPLAGWLAGTLHQNGATVTWLNDETGAQAIREHGLVLAQDRLQNLSLVTQMTAAKKPDLIIMAMYPWQSATATAELATFLPPGSTPPNILSLMAGSGGYERLAAAFGAQQVLYGTMTEHFHFMPSAEGDPAPLRNVIIAGQRGGLALEADHPLTARVGALLKKLPMPIKFGPRQSIMWSSILWQLQGNALSAILNQPASAIYRNAPHFAIEHEMLVEAVAIIKRLGVQLMALPGANVPALVRLLGWLPRGAARRVLPMGDPPPSLREELQWGLGRSSAAYLNGAVALAADDLNLRAPVNHALALIVTDIAEGRALWSAYQEQPEMLAATLRLARG